MEATPVTPIPHLPVSATQADLHTVTWKGFVKIKSRVLCRGICAHGGWDDGVGPRGSHGSISCQDVTPASGTVLSWL